MIAFYFMFRTSVTLLETMDSIFYIHVHMNYHSIHQSPTTKFTAHCINLYIKNCIYICYIYYFGAKMTTITIKVICTKTVLFKTAVQGEGRKVWYKLSQ